jgi:hypothetical protein
MLDLVRSLLKTSKVVDKTVQVLRADKANEQVLSASSMEEFLPKWADAMTFPAAGMRSSLQPAATAGDIERAESRLGLRFPEELQLFYLCANGIDREFRGGDGPARNVLPVQSLAKPGTQRPLPSSLLRDEWLANGRDDGDPEGLSVFSADLASLLPGSEKFVLPFVDVDDMLILESPGLGALAVAVVKTHARFCVGTILEIENGTATYHDGIRAWLASGMSVMMRSKGQYGRYLK